jgi:predicted phage tail protein
MTSSVLGHKGGKSGASSGGYSEAPNTLRSATTVRLIDLISEGPCVGIVGGLQGILLDNVPLQNADLSFNFEGVIADERFGTPNQEVVAGFPNTETPFSLNTAVTKVIPVTFSVSDTSVDAVRVVVGVNQLTTQSTTDGSLKGASVQLTIEVKLGAGPYVLASTVDITGKTTSPYQRSIRVDLPPGAGGWTIRVSRVTLDSVDASLSNATILFGYSELKDGLFNYPDSALVGLTLDSTKFGTSLKQRTYRYRGLICSVPVNYDPVTRIYTGLWNGTFKQAWTNNPAWVLYALMTHPRFGLGQYIPASSVDKAALYTIGQYCDGSVPDGLGGTEPRFTYNGVLRTQEDAAKVLDTIASVFRGMIYWGAGVVTATIDAPGTAATLVTPANVIDGNFEYVGASLRTRSSSVAVTWNDPKDYGKQSVIIVQRDNLIRKFGERRKDIAAVGCTSRGQAQRVAEWLLYTEEYETEVVSYQASLDHAALRPGALINIADPAYAGARFGGRLVDGMQTGVIHLDAPVTFSNTVSNQISTVKPTGEIVTKAVTPIAKNQLLQTRDQSAAVWTKVNATAVSGTALDPFGASTAGSLTEPATASLTHYASQPCGMVYSGSYYTYSAYVKRGSGSRNYSMQLTGNFGTTEALFNLTAGTYTISGASVNTTASITSIGSGWYRCTITGLATSTGVATATAGMSNSTSTVLPAYVGNGTSSLQIWGSQVEIGTEAGTYVENTTTASVLGDFDVVVATGGYALPTDVPLPGSMWVVTTSNVAPRLFRVISNTEKAANVYEITAVISNPSKYNYIERNLDLTSTPSTLFSMDAIDPPTGLTAIAYRKMDSGSIAKLAYLVSWKASTDPRVVKYKLWLVEAGEAETLVWEGRELSAEVFSPLNASNAFTFRVRAYGFNDDSSTDATYSNNSAYAWVPPAVPTGWIGVPGVSSVQLSSPNYSPSPDFQFFRIYSCATIGGTYVLIGTSKTPNFVYTVTAGAVPSYYKISAVDYSGLESAQTAAIPLAPSNQVGSTYPATPANLTSSSALVSDGVSRVTFTWDANTEANLVGYDVTITENGSSPVTSTVTTNRWSSLFKPGTVVTAKISAVNNLGNRSIAPTSTVSRTAAVDTTPPAIPTLAAVGAGYGNLYLSWSLNSEVDFHHYEVFEQATSTPAPTNQGVPFSYRTTDITYDRAGMSELQTLHFWVRAVDTSGNASNWSTRQQGTTLSLTGTQPAPGVPGSVAVTTAYVSDGRSTVTATWTAGTNAVGYDIGVTRSGGSETILFSSLLSATFDAEPGIAYSVRVRSTSVVSAKSAWVNAATYPINASADTTPPAVPTQSAIVAGFAELWVSWTQNAESDFDHYEIFEQATTTPVPTNGAAPYSFQSLTSNFLRSGLGASVSRSYWVRAVDTSGNLSNWSAIQTGTTLTIEGTQAAPAVPTTVTLASASVANGRSTITVSWVAGANAVGYEIGVTRSGSAETILNSSLLTTAFECQPGISYAIRIRSISNLGVKSAWVTATGSPITAAVDAVAPAALEFTSITAGYGTMWLVWPAAVEADFAYYGIKQTLTSTAPTVGTAPDFTTPSTVLTVSGLANSTAYWYWIRTYDTSGNKSAWSAVATTATTPAATAITTAALTGLVNATSFVSSVKPIEVVGTLPATALVAGRMVFLTTDGKLYRYNTTPTTGWTVATDGADIIANTITGGKIVAGAISTTQLAANAVTASKVLIGDTSDSFPDPLMVDPAAYSSPTLVLSTGYSFVANTTNGPSQNYLRIIAAVGEVVSLPCMVEETQSYLFSAYMNTSGAGVGTPTLKVRWYSDNAGTTVLSTSTIGTTASTTATRISGAVTTPVGARSLRMVFAQDTASPTVNVHFGTPSIRLKNKGELIVDGTIFTNHIQTNTITAASGILANLAVTDAKIATLAANKLTVAALNAGITVGVTGTTIGTVESRAADPAARVNAASTQITPGKISVTGAGTGIGLDGWITNGTTTIDGGKITADSITAKAMLLTDFSNLYMNPQFINGTADGWLAAATTAVVAKTGTTGILGTMSALNARSHSVTLATVSNVSQYFTDGKLPVIPGQQYYFECQVAITGSSLSTSQIAIRETYTDGTTAIVVGLAKVHSGGVGTWSTVTFGATPSAGYTVPANCCSLELGFGVCGPMAAGTDLAYATNFVGKRKNSAELIVDGSILATHVGTNEIIAQTANIKDSIITSAKIANLAAGKITVGALNAGITVGVTGTTIGTVETRAADPAARVNAVATTITPGKISITAGAAVAGTLDEWISPSTTTINGGKITADTITVNQLAAGSVTAKSLTLTDFSNLFMNPQFANNSADGWAVVSGTTLVAKAGTTGILGTMPGIYARTYTAALAGTGNVVEFFQNGKIPVIPGAEHYFEFAFASNTTAAGTAVRIKATLTNGTTVITSGAFRTAVASNVWQKETYTYVVPTSTAFIEIGYAVRGPMASGTDVVYVTAFLCKQRVSASLIVDGAITTRSLKVTGSAAGALNADPNTQDITAWEGVGLSLSTITDSPVGGATALRLTGAAHAYSTMIPVDPNQDFRYEAWGRAVGGHTDTAYFLVSFFDGSGSPITAFSDPVAATWPSTGTFFYFGRVNQALSASFTKYQISFGPGETAKIPATAKFMEVGVLANYTTGGTNASEFTGLRVQQKAKADLIVEGAFAASGLAVFGDTLQSTNFVAGTSGWQITNAGNAELNSLIVRSDMIASGAVTASKFVGLSGVGKSLNIDPHFQDSSAWAVSSGTGTFVTLSDGVSGLNAARSANGAHFFSRAFPVNVSKQYRLRSWYRRSSTANGNTFLRMYFYDVTGTQISYDENNVLLPGSVGTAWNELNKSPIVPPAGAVTGKVVAILNYGGTLGYHEVQGLSCEELADRDTITNGAVSDKFQAILLGPLTTIADGMDIELLRLSVGPRVAGNILKRAWAVELRNPDSRGYTIYLQTRSKYIGTWSAWSTNYTVTMPGSVPAWEVWSTSGTVAGNYEDREYRICTNNNPATSALTGGDFIKNLYITAVELVR